MGPVKTIAEMIVEAIIAKEPVDRGGVDNRHLLKRLKERESEHLRVNAASRET